jgi:hypothetical protein
MRLVEILIMTLAGVWQGIRQDFNLLEICLIAAGIWAWNKRGWRPRPFRPRQLHRTWTPRRPWLSAVALITGVIALRLALIPLLPVPVPIVTDEFSHLLLADTLLHGRVANPTHPFWQHFESLHIIQQPHYVSNYFPGHALVLAAGILALHSPWAGVLAECAAFLGILYWALRGWMPSRWALFGVLLAALRFAIGSYWVTAYHGGFLPAAGGALIFGAFARLRKRASFSHGLFTHGLFSHGLVLGLGLAILAGSRPFEGLAFALPFAAVLAWEFRNRVSALAQIAIPAVAVAGIMVVGLGVYFTHITGSPFVTAYQISQKTYGWPMGLAWTPTPRVEHRHIELARYYNYEIGEHEKVDGPIDFIEFLTFRLQEYWRFFLGPALTVPLIMLPRVWKRRRMLFAGLAGALAAVLLEGAASPHYLAPATALIVAILVECCRHLNASRVRILPLLPAVMALVLVLRIGAQTAGLPYTQKLNFQSWCCRVEGNLNKARITATLRHIPGDHLVFVKTKTDEMNLFQWIYNDADIDHSRIVWARDLGAGRNQQLQAYFAARQVWLVDPNVEPATCVQYDAASIITSETASRSNTPPPRPDRR